jgi:hypothetical protein
MRLSGSLSAKLLCCLLFLVAAQIVAAGPVFDRPYIGSEGTTTWSPTGNYILGDDLSIPVTQTIYSLSVWFVAAKTTTTDPAQEISSMRLFGGADPGPLTLLASTYTFHTEGFTYAGPFSNPRTNTQQPLFKITFDNLNWTLQAGVLYDFAVEGTPIAPDGLFALTATNALDANTPGPGQGADGIFLAFNGKYGTGPYNLYFTYPGAVGDPLVGDINVILNPEPSSIVLMGLGGAALLLVRRFRK